MIRHPTQLDISLGAVLHDGNLIMLAEHALEQTLILTWDVPYIWEFHNLPSETRFVMTLQGVRDLQILEFQPWSGSRQLPASMPWREQELIRLEDAEKGTYKSKDWCNFASTTSTVSYKCQTATITTVSSSNLLLSLALESDISEDSLTARFTCTRVLYAFKRGRQLSFSEFLAMGEAYWNDWDNFATRTTEQKNTEEL